MDCTTNAQWDGEPSYYDALLTKIGWWAELAIVGV